MGLMLEAWWCFVRYLLYIVPFAAALVTVHFTLRIPRELFRKMLHVAAFTSTPVIMWLSGDWLVTVMVLVTFGVVVWPLLAAVEGQPWYDGLFVQRRLHEVRRSLLLMFWGSALLVAVCWGAFARPDVAATSILMWGFGDAAAALVGKRWGRHHTGLPLADPHKTWEGSGAMCAVSFVVGTGALVACGAGGVLGCAVRAAVAALAGSYVELITRKGYDTITVPFAIAAVLLCCALLA